MSTYSIPLPDGVMEKRSRFPKFVLSVLPSTLITEELVLPEEFVLKCGDLLPLMVKFSFPNGDVFECEYSNIRRSFMVTSKLFHRYNVMSYSLLSFEYFSRGDFFVRLIGNGAVEIEYPMPACYFASETLVDNYVTTASSTTSSLDTGLQDDINAALLEYNGNFSEEGQIEFIYYGKEVELIDSSMVIVNRHRVPNSYWSNDSGVYLSARSHFWKLKVKKVNGISSFKDGWKEFISEIGLAIGDLVVLYEDGNPFRFQVALFKNYNSIGTSVSTGLFRPAEFVRFVNTKLLVYGELTVPRLFWQKYERDLGTELELNVSGGGKHCCSYSSSLHKFICQPGFLVENSIEESSFLLFRYLGNCCFNVTIFSKNRVDINFPEDVCLV